MNKIIGYVIAVIGLAVLVLYVFPSVAEKITFLESVDSLIILIAALVIIAIGVIFIFKGRKKGVKSGSQVPIYHGDNVVGYRQH